MTGEVGDFEIGIDAIGIDDMPRLIALPIGLERIVDLSKLSLDPPEGATAAFILWVKE